MRLSALLVVLTFIAPESPTLAQQVLPPRNLLGDESTEAALRHKLAQTTDLHYRETRLTEVLDQLKLRGIPIYVDVRALEEVGYTPDDIAITFDQASIRIRDGLDLMLRAYDLTWMYDRGRVVITTFEQEESMLVTRVYDVRNLVPYSNRRHYEFDALMQMIESTVAPETWDNVGGPGSMMPYVTHRMRVLVISQTRETHERIAAMLERLAEFGGRKPLPPVVYQRRSYSHVRPTATSLGSSTPNRPTNRLRSSKLRSSGE